ncbi:MAG: TonB-dependent receptor [Bacteroidetes bacterium]|nr:TonB-dependent receptor [Bacteroidota bacterium]
MNLRPFLYVFILSLLHTLIVCGQATQAVGGRVIGPSGPLPNVALILQGKQPYSAQSDSLGRFLFNQVPVGRYLLSAAFPGLVFDGQEVLVTAAKKIELTVELKESLVPIELDEIEVSSARQEIVPGNYGLAIEKTIRVAANFFDPLRLATTLPGVVPANDQGNSIAIRGYSPNAILWRLQGLDIVNPNHLANAGTLNDRPVSTGGGVSVLSAQVLDKTNFYNGVLPASIGNVLSGAIDMSLRIGNQEKPEYGVQAGLLGIDLSAEGPLSSKANGSYLVNFRYSTVGLLSKAGVNFGDEEINFSDLTFHFFNPLRKGGTLSVFGFAGVSSNEFLAKDQSNWESEKDRYNIHFSGGVQGVGLRLEKKIWNSQYLKTGLAFSGINQDRHALSKPVPFPHLMSDSSSFIKSVISGFIQITENRKYYSSESGLNFSSTHDDLAIRTVSSSGIGPDFSSFSGRVSTFLFQPFTSWTWNFLGWKWNTALRYVFNTASSSGSFEPRMVVNHRFIGGLLSGGYGITSQTQPAILLAQPGFRRLPMTKSHQLYMEYSRSLGTGLTFRSSIYRHYLTRIPVTSNAVNTLSWINQFDEFMLAETLVEGNAIHQGVEGNVEKKFNNNFYFSASGSLYTSRFKDDQSGKFLPTRFSGRYTSAFLSGKEWQLRKQVIGLHIKILAFGGQRQPVIDQEASEAAGTTIFTHQSGYAIQLPNYQRLDLRVNWRKNKTKFTRTISIDIQNVTNRLNSAGYYYDTFLRSIKPRYQLGIIPVLTWRLDF